MSTIEEIARKAIAKAGSDVGVRIAAVWANDRWKELSRPFHLKHLRKERELQIIPAIDDGTVTATRDSKIVTGDSDAQAVWGPEIEGRYFRGRVAWYRIAQYQSTQLILETPFSEDTLTSGSYDIIKRFYDLPADVKHLAKTMSLQRLHKPVPVISMDRLNQIRPSRPVFGFPAVVAELGLDDTDSVRRIEVYPTPESESEILHYICWIKPPDLGFRDELPGFINEEVLEEAVLVDLLRQEGIKMVREGRQGGVELLNESRRQNTEWLRKKREQLIDEVAIDDAEFVMDPFQFQGSGFRDLAGYDIVTAYDAVWTR